MNSPSKPPPLVSIITPSYQQGKYIKDTIQSVLTQDYPNIEYIVIDGGSSDQTIDILKQFESRLTWISERDEGQSDAINKGFRMARGEIIAWLNSDDIYLPGCVSSAVKTFQEHPEAAMVYGKAYNIDEKGERRSDCGVGDWDLFRLIHMRNIICQPSVFMRKTALEGAGYLKESFHYAMDWDLWIRIGIEFPVIHVNEFWACNRDYESSKTGTGAFRRVWECYLCTQYGALRFAPAVRAYMLEAIVRWMNRQDLLWLNRLKDRLRKPLFEKLVSLFEQETGMYPKGLVAPRAFLTVRNTNSMHSAVIRYEKINSMDREVVVRVRINNRQAGCFKVSSLQGVQTVTFQVPPTRGDARLTHFEFESNCFTELQINKKGSQRAVSFTLLNVDFL
jgi:glycosyltransferase involved in cell wall biosynthesis